MRFTNPNCCACPWTANRLYLTALSYSSNNPQFPWTSCDCLPLNQSLALDFAGNQVLPDPPNPGIPGFPYDPTSRGRLTRRWEYRNNNCGGAVGNELAINVWCLGHGYTAQGQPVGSFWVSGGLTGGNNPLSPVVGTFRHSGQGNSHVVVGSPCTPLYVEFDILAGQHFQAFAPFWPCTPAGFLIGSIRIALSE